MPHPLLPPCNVRALTHPTSTTVWQCKKYMGYSIAMCGIYVGIEMHWIGSTHVVMRENSSTAGRVWLQQDRLMVLALAASVGRTSRARCVASSRTMANNFDCGPFSRMQPTFVRLLNLEALANLILFSHLKVPWPSAEPSHWPYASARQQPVSQPVQLLQLQPRHWPFDPRRVRCFAHGGHLLRLPLIPLFLLKLLVLLMNPPAVLLSLRPSLVRLACALRTAPGACLQPRGLGGVHSSACKSTYEVVRGEGREGKRVLLIDLFVQCLPRFEHKAGACAVAWRC